MSIRTLTFAEIPKAVELCVNAFLDHDPLIQYTYGTSPNKRELVTHLYPYAVFWIFYLLFRFILSFSFSAF